MGQPARARGRRPNRGGARAHRQRQATQLHGRRLVAGDIPTAPEWHELKQVNTPGAPANNIEVISNLAGYFVAGMGLPPAFFLHEKLTGRTSGR